jgi:hypothetical protein
LRAIRKVAARVLDKPYLSIVWKAHQGQVRPLQLGADVAVDAISPFALRILEIHPALPLSFDGELPYLATFQLSDRQIRYLTAPGLLTVAAKDVDVSGCGLEKAASYPGLEIIATLATDP